MCRHCFCAREEILKVSFALPSIVYWQPCLPHLLPLTLWFMLELGLWTLTQVFRNQNFGAPLQTVKGVGFYSGYHFLDVCRHKGIVFWNIEELHQPDSKRLDCHWVITYFEFPSRSPVIHGSPKATTAEHRRRHLPGALKLWRSRLKLWICAKKSWFQQSMLSTFFFYFLNNWEKLRDHFPFAWYVLWADVPRLPMQDKMPGTAVWFVLHLWGESCHT